ncbi:MAG: AsmA family protein [Bacteroidales bacterium]|nr:AsmA family protein [Bacteroidales bacterium]
MDTITAPQLPQKKGRFKKVILGFILTLFLLLFLLIVVAFAFESKIADLFLQKTYQFTTTEITHKDVHLSLLRKFPSASLEIQDLHAKGNHKDFMLLQAEKVFLQFNVMDIIKGNYTIKKIEIDNAVFNMVLDKKGKNNWEVFITEDTVSDENFRLDINVIELKNIDYSYIDQQSDFEFASSINHLTAKGNYDNQTIAAHVNTKLAVKHILTDNDTIVRQQNVKFNTQLHLNLKTDVYQIENSNFVFDFMKCNIVAKLAGCGANDYLLEAQFSTDKANIVAMTKLLPDSIKMQTTNYKPKGNLSCTINIKGLIGEKSTCNINGKYQIDNMNISNIQTDISLSKINVEGSFSTQIPNYKPHTRINIDYFTANLNRGNINGTIKIADLAAPSVDLNVQAELKLQDWQNFMPKTYIHQASGYAEIALAFKHKFQNTKNISPLELNQSTIQGYALFKKVDFQMKENDFAFENLNGKFVFNNQYIEAEKIEGTIKGNDFELNGRIENIFPYLLQSNQDLKIIAKLNLKHFNLDKFLVATQTENSRKNTEKQQLTFPKQIYFDFNFHADKITYQNFETKATSCQAILANNTLFLHNFTADAFKGNLQANGKIVQKNENVFDISCHADMKNIDIERLFYSFSDFGQKDLTHKNLKGVANCTVDFSTQMQQDLTILDKTLKTNAAIAIENGELNKFKPLESLSKFISLSELNNIKFQKLATTIKIANRTITIPEIDIRNTALNLTLSGTHTFDHDIDYHVVVSLQELLSQKFANNKKKRKQREDFGDVVDVNTSVTYLYIKAGGNLDNPKFGWDTQSANHGLNKKISAQKEEIKQANTKKQQNSPTSSYTKPTSQKHPELELDEDW